MKPVISAMTIMAVCLTVSACKVSETKEAKMPKVDVKTTSGQMPEYNIQGPDVKVGSKTETIKVPTVKVKTPD